MLELDEVVDATFYVNKNMLPEEVVYELRTRKNQLPFGMAIADIQQSEPHYHEFTLETYTVVQGELEVTLGTVKHRLKVGEAIEIPPGTVHFARSTGELPARITVATIPEWSQDDHLRVSATD